MINEQIRDPEVRVIDENGGQLGIMDIRSAQKLADERTLDLVKIAPNSVPPVCKLMDYGKYRFDMIKKDKEQRKNQKIVELSSLRDTLQDLVDTCQGDHRPDCPILKGLESGSCCA